MEIQWINMLPSNWVHALCVTLFHSLWMGLILGLLTSLVILGTRKSSASVRYNLLTVLLGLFVVGMGFIFYQALVLPGAAPGSITYAKQGINVTSGNPAAVILVNTSIIGQLNILMNSWAAYGAQIVLIWFIVICAKCTQLMLGLKRVHYLQNNSVFDAGIYWEDRIKALAERLGVSHGVKLLQSALIKVPMVAGHFKPVILLPLGLLNGLSGSEIEAILSHELSHIRRRDYLVNIMQSIIEIIFFFNPAVLWISALIKAERENCCDDLALSCTGNKQEYIKALISCQEFQMANPEYAMAITGGKNQLLERVSRIVFNKSASLNKVEKTLLTVALIFTFLFSAAFTMVNKSGYLKKGIVKISRAEIFQDTLKRIQKRTSIKRPTPHKEKVFKTTREVKRLSAEQQSLLEEQQSAIHEARAAIEEAKASAQEEKAAAREAREVKRDAENRNADAKYKRESANYRAAAEKYKKAAERYSQSAARYAREQAKHQANFPTPPPMPPMAPLPPLLPLPPAPPALAPVSIPPVPPAPPVPPLLDEHVSSKEVKTRVRKRVKITTDGSRILPEDTDEINIEMTKDGLIKKGNLSYVLDDHSFIVNGKKQSDVLHQKYKLKYLKSSNTSLVYNYQVSSNNK